MSRKYHDSADIPNDVIADRLDALAKEVTHGIDHNEFTMRVPAELDRDADLVLSEAAKRIRNATK